MLIIFDDYLKISFQKILKNCEKELITIRNLVFKIALLTNRKKINVIKIE